MKDVEIEFPFSRQYEVRLLDELPSSAGDSRRVLYFPGATASGGRDGLLLEVIPDDSPAWIGVFAFGRIRRTFSAVVGGPAGSNFFVAAKGAGYLVDSARRAATDLSITPIAGIYALPKKNVVILASINSLASYGRDGLAWVTHVSADHFTVIDVADEQIRGIGWDPANQSEVPFEVDVPSGNLLGGPEPLRTER
jgi:hypothetical protein